MGQILVSGTFDIEAQDWSTYVIGGLYDGKNYESFRSRSDLLDELLRRGGTWWGHYSGAYDMLCLLAEHAARTGDKVRLYMAGSRITCALFGKQLCLRDSYAIAPLPLAKFAKLSGMEKTNPGLPCVCNEQCGGYCSIRVDMSESHYRLVDGYMEVDCRILYASLTYWLDFLRTNFGEPKGTIGASSFKFTKQRFVKWHSSAIYRWVKESYYGGRVEVWKRESPVDSIDRFNERLAGKNISPRLGGFHDDINSAYVDALRLLMPVGEPKETYRSIPSSAKYYCAEAVVNVPACHIPPLPLRCPDRLYYPVGRFFGRWNQTMLEAAVQDGATIEKIGRVVYWEALEAPYVDFCNHVWNLRSSSGKNTVAGKLLKQLSVSVCGKLAQRPEVTEVVYSPTPIIGWKSLNPSNVWWYRDKFKIADCAWIHHAGEMTAHVQVRVRRRGNSHGEGAVYCDTDGVFGEKEIVDGLGSDLGEWLRSGAEQGHDGRYYDFGAMGPKLYFYYEQDWEFRAKGFDLGQNPSKHYETIGAIINGEEIEVSRGVYPLLSAIRKQGSIFTRRKGSKRFHSSPQWCGGRIKEGAIDTRPPHVSEIWDRIRNQEEWEL